MIEFRNIPQSLRLPGFFAELDPSKANTATETQRALVIGQITAAGLAAANVPLICAGVADARVQAGAGSLLAGMIAAYRQNDPFGEVWYGPLADAGGGAAATGTITFVGPPTAAGVVSLYIAGNLAHYGQAGPIQVPVTAAETVASIATAVAAAINAITDLPVTASANAGVVTLTAVNKGLVGNDIDVRANYLGSAAGEVTPAGLAINIVAMSGGTTNPVLTTLLANLTDTPFDFIVSPYTDATSVAALTAFLNDVAGRWSWQVQIYGHVFMAYRGTFSQQTTFGVAMNDQHASCVGNFDSPSPSWAIAAAAAGVTAVSVRADASKPITGLTGAVLHGILPPPTQSRFSPSLRNTLLFDGISTTKVVNGQLVLEQLITTYQRNAGGLADNSYLMAGTMFKLMFVLRDLQAFVVNNFADTKLAADGTKAGPLAGVVTPAIIKASLISHYRQLEVQGEVQNSAGFAAALQVQINQQNPNRVDVLFPPTLMEDLDTFAALAQFLLQ